MSAENWRLIANRSGYDRTLKLWPAPCGSEPEMGFDLRRFAAQLGEGMDPYLRRQGVTLINTIGEEAWVYGGKEELKRLLMRLLGNIFHALSKQKSAKTVRLSCRHGHDCVMLVVEDNAGSLSKRHGCGLTFKKCDKNAMLWNNFDSGFGGDIFVEELKGSEHAESGARFTIPLRAGENTEKITAPLMESTIDIVL